MSEKPQLTLYNSLTRKKEVFVPQDPKRVTMYNCGPTVYSYAHIGNARAAVVADVLFRVLRHIYGEDHVIYARNITCLLYTSPSPRDKRQSRMPSSA